MPRISAFRGLRYDVGHVGSLEGVVAPDLGCIDAAMQKELYQRHPANVVRLIRNREEPGDEPGDQSARAGRFFRNWQREGVLQREPDPAIYVYHQVAANQQVTRGFIGLLEMTDEVIVKETSVDQQLIGRRLELLRAAEANLAMVTGVYSTLESEVQDVLDEAVINVAPIETQDATGTIHHIWPVTDIERVNAASTLAASIHITIVGGAADFLAAKHRVDDDSNFDNSKVMVALFESDQLDPLDAESIA